MIIATQSPSIKTDLKVAHWKLNDKNSIWSSAFFKTLGYKQEEINPQLNYFLNNLIHKKNRSLFRDNYFNLVRQQIGFKQIISVFCKDGSVKEFLCKTNDELPNNKHNKGNKLIYFYERKFKTNKKLTKSRFYHQETAEMTSTGSWYVDFEKSKTYWDYQTKTIMEYPEDYTPSLKGFKEYFSQDHHKLACSTFSDCAMYGTAINTEIKMRTANGRIFWAKAIGKAVYNDANKIIGVRGVFQDIDEKKSQMLSLQKKTNTITAQNERLLNFAHIVSHNLRSHTSNLTLVTELIDDIKSKEEKLEFLGTIKDISESLNTTIRHLNEVVTIQTQTQKNTVNVKFETTLNIIKKSISNIISENNCNIHTNFSLAPSIHYIPAYLESIILNLITNSIKYKHPDRTPQIRIKTYLKNKKTYLEISDNGIGIDLNKFGDKLFGMYNTFHYNKDAVGIGLFITKNQIEALNGQITVDSTVNHGTTFKIQF